MSLHEGRHKHEHPRQKKGISIKHQILDAFPCTGVIFVNSDLPHPPQRTRTDSLANFPSLGYSFYDCIVPMQLDTFCRDHGA